ncbi:type III pantothenate kinase [Fulvivirga sedimenti]|uniref:Type III pantothenate kinase n=1 Tax=Fulvivirga sedimenti TaxID=2879465 RepID=A0A9X1HUH1_9BACT|nr:type III pantothenate kinase [Fulvivirga sedimenti]MCA6078180.1 type III pantothenate kinase [Fulvivirga sedimenti]
MNLILDFGNSSAKAGLFNGLELVKVYDRLALDEISELARSRTFEYIFASTVSVGKDTIREKIGQEVSFLSHETSVPFQNQYKTPETLGLDRIAAVAGAQQRFPDTNCLAIDIGSCITYDHITASGDYFGGGISPGLDIRFKSLHTFTAGLPLIEFQEEAELVGNSTRNSILSGVIFGMQAEIEGIIRMYEDKFGDLKIILCGGGSKVFENRLKGAIFAAPHLVLEGLNRILSYNVS